MAKTDIKPKQASIFSLLKPYRGLVSMLILFALFSNSVTLWLPKIINHGIDAYIHSLITHTHFDV
ncbi:MAG: putative transporter ATP-binding protein, partial [Mucilaginibacter sp.]|nr:putative transporter ATP-binding protein [Mucilaginibacter sp.]